MNESPGSRLIFNWPTRFHVSLLLPLFVGFSLLAHALAFYVFQIVYPPAASIAPPPVQVSLLVPDSPENITALNRIYAETPSFASSAADIAPYNMLELHYHPSFAEIHTAPKSVEAEDRTISYPTVMGGMALLDQMDKQPQSPAKPAIHFVSTVNFSGINPARTLMKQIPLHIKSTSPDVLKPAQFLFGITNLGEVRYCFLQASSGNANVDAQAETYLCHLQFSASQEPIAWGTATYLWGNEIYPSPAPAP